MAIYHMSVKTVSRSKGRSAVAAAAYRAAERLHDLRTGEVADYRKKGGVVHREILAPEGAPEWVKDRAKLWNTAESMETRKNSTTAREYEIALPAELTAVDRLAMTREFARWLTDRFQVAADIAIHQPGRGGDQRNHHAHIMTTTRAVAANGPLQPGQKTRELDDKKSGAIQEVREKWAEIQNRHLKRAKAPELVNHRSHAMRGIEALPGTHLGPAATGMERRQIPTDRGRGNRVIMSMNSALRAAEQALQAARARAGNSSARPSLVQASGATNWLDVEEALRKRREAREMAAAAQRSRGRDHGR